MNRLGVTLEQRKAHASLAPLMRMLKSAGCTEHEIARTLKVSRGTVHYRLTCTKVERHQALATYLISAAVSLAADDLTAAGAALKQASDECYARASGSSVAPVVLRFRRAL